MSNSPLVNKVILTENRGNYGSDNVRRDGRWDTIKKITIHHTAGVISAEAVANSFLPTVRQASANYIIGGDGTIVMSVEEKDRAWTSGSSVNDNQAITIEVCNSTGAPNWEVSDTALKRLIALCADICKRNNIKKLNFTGDATGNLTMHKYFQATACPGPYLGAKFPYIADQVNAILNGEPIEPVVATYEPTYQVYSAKNGWLAQITGYNNNNELGYAGWRGQAMQGIRLFVNGLDVKYRAHLRNGGWLSWVTKSDNTNEGYAGWYGNNIDGIQMALTNAPAGYHIEYRTSIVNGEWLSWVRDYGEGDNGYSGWFGKSLDRLQVRIVKDGISTTPTTPTIPTTPTVSTPTTSAPSTTNNTSLKVGDKVKLKPNATYFNGQPIPSFVFNSTLYVRGIRTDGTIIISTQATGAVTGIVKPEALETSEVTSLWPAVPFVVRIKNLTPIKAGPSANDSNKGSLSTGAFTIISISGNYGRLKSGAGWIDLNDTTIL